MLQSKSIKTGPPTKAMVLKDEAWTSHAQTSCEKYILIYFKPFFIWAFLLDVTKFDTNQYDIQEGEKYSHASEDS